MSIATYRETPWIATVYYVIDDDLNLYFLSDPTTQHGQDIAKNKKVACAIFNSDQKVTDQKVGIQLWGECLVVRSLEKIKWMLKMWHKINPGVECVSLEKIKKKVVNTQIYKVIPKKIKFFNEKLYSKKEAKMFYL